jgi:hypothetical protein
MIRISKLEVKIKLLKLSTRYARRIIASDRVCTDSIWTYVEHGTSPSVPTTNTNVYSGLKVKLKILSTTFLKIFHSLHVHIISCHETLPTAR